MNNCTISDTEKSLFLEQVWAYYRQYARQDLPWRQPDADGAFDPYKVLVSELMLQQTQVARVVPKYNSFLQRFPTVEILAQATLGDVLKEWQGLGYNRRAKYLWQTACTIHEIGYFPSTQAELIKLPGVGVNTAGAILAYAFNEPAVFIETNIRTVYIHHFFKDQEHVSDKAIRELLAQTLDGEHVREYYWALMDYGTWLKSHTHTNQQSKHYTRQSQFEGSRRQLRGRIIRELTAESKTKAELGRLLKDDRLTRVIDELVREGLITKNRTKHSL